MHKNTKKIDIYKLFAIFSLKNIIIGFLAVASWSFFGAWLVAALGLMWLHLGWAVCRPKWAAVWESVAAQRTTPEQWIKG